PAHQTGHADFRIRLSDQLHREAHGESSGRKRPLRVAFLLRLTIQLSLKGPDLFRCCKAHRQSPSKARRKSRSFPPPAAHGGLCHEASTQMVAHPSRSSATGSIDNSPGGSYLHWRHTHTGRTSFDHLVDAANQRQRDGEAERLGGLHVDDELDFGRLLDRQLGGLLAFENSACIDAERAVRIQNGASVSHEAASGYKLA